MMITKVFGSYGESLTFDTNVRMAKAETTGERTGITILEDIYFTYPSKAIVDKVMEDLIKKYGDGPVDNSCIKRGESPNRITVYELPEGFREGTTRAYKVQTADKSILEEMLESFNSDPREPRKTSHSATSDICLRDRVREVFNCNDIIHSPYDAIDGPGLTISERMTAGQLVKALQEMEQMYGSDIMNVPVFIDDGQRIRFIDTHLHLYTSTCGHFHGTVMVAAEEKTPRK